jgi:hypothetical protein
MGALADGGAEGGPAFGGGDAAGEAHAGPAGTGSSSDRTRHLGLGLAGLSAQPLDGALRQPLQLLIVLGDH